MHVLSRHVLTYCDTYVPKPATFRLRSSLAISYDRPFALSSSVALSPTFPSLYARQTPFFVAVKSVNLCMFCQRKSTYFGAGGRDVYWGGGGGGAVVVGEGTSILKLFKTKNFDAWQFWSVAFAHTTLLAASACGACGLSNSCCLFFNNVQKDLDRRRLFWMACVGSDLESALYLKHVWNNADRLSVCVEDEFLFILLKI